MSRDGSGVYHRPVGTDAVTDTTIESTKYNVNVADVEQDLNLPRPIVAGGTGATSADGALDSLSAEKFKQIVTNWDATTWRAGSFYAATTATGAAPVAGHAFAGIAYYANATDLILEAIDLTDPINPTKYIRIMTAGVWGNWLLATATGGSTGDYNFDSTLTFPPASGQIRFNNATQNSTTEIFISHLTATGADNTGLITASIKSGYTLYIQDKDEPTKYKVFVTTANPVLSGGDFRVTVAFSSGGTNIVSGQRILLNASTGSAVCYDIVQNLTAATQQAQARANIGVTKKNYLLNGAMTINQEGIVSTGVSQVYAADQWINYTVNAGTWGFAQNGTPTSPAGSPYRLSFQCAVADVSVGAADQAIISQVIEGLRMADLQWGTAAAKTITIQFGVRAPAGTYCLALTNGPQNRNYVAEYVIAAGEANTDVVRSITIPGDTSGTWAKDNTQGMYLLWMLMAGSNFVTTPNAWGAVYKPATANQFNLMGTLGNTFYLCDVGMYEGTVAPPFQVPDYASELALCGRYWQRINTYRFDGYNVAGTTALNTVLFPPMRSAPTVTFSGVSSTNCSVPSAFGATASSVGIYVTVTASSSFSSTSTGTMNARL